MREANSAARFPPHLESSGRALAARVGLSVAVVDDGHGYIPDCDSARLLLSDDGLTAIAAGARLRVDFTAGGGGNEWHKRVGPAAAASLAVRAVGTPRLVQQSCGVWAYTRDSLDTACHRGGDDASLASPPGCRTIGGVVMPATPSDALAFDMTAGLARDALSMASSVCVGVRVRVRACALLPRDLGRLAAKCCSSTCAAHFPVVPLYPQGWTVVALERCGSIAALVLDALERARAEP